MFVSFFLLLEKKATQNFFERIYGLILCLKESLNLTQIVGILQARLVIYDCLRLWLRLEYSFAWSPLCLDIHGGENAKELHATYVWSSLCD